MISAPPYDSTQNMLWPCRKLPNLSVKLQAGELEEMTLHDVADDIKGTTGSLIKFVAAGRADLDLLRNIQARIAAHLEEKAQPT